jgi:hypothetical protein
MISAAGHVYVIAFDNGIVKVGRTKDLRDRMRAHRGDGRLPFTSPHGKPVPGRPPKCPKGHESARECVIRIAALDARAHETAQAAGSKRWVGLRPLVACGRCA